MSSFKESLNLPKTDFPLRHDKNCDTNLLASWESTELYEATYKKNEGKEKFVLHDGPPYANGNIHLGHALNKILKDIICKYKRMSGKHVPFRPGWDCHGLPIEFKVTSELGLEKEKGKIDPQKLKAECRKFASKWIEIQKQEFKNLGVAANWNNPYKTMDFAYEANILRSFAKFVENGFIERKGKTVPWCASCQTVLATAEIEYEDRKDPSIYIFFELRDFSFQNYEVGLLVWTTTPWTIPLNRAVVLNPDAQYELIKLNEKRAIIVGQELSEPICKLLNIEKVALKNFSSKELSKFKAKHPIVPNLEVPVLLDNMVSLKDGTAVLHMAPGCGPEDYLAAVRNGIEIFSPISSSGHYTHGIEPKELEGMAVSDGQIWVIKKLAEVGALVFKNSIRHPYPHCWRCHNGLIFRATDQWFCNLSRKNLLNNTIAEIEKIKFVPEWGKTRLSSTIGNRTEWCISRQRHWGVPIPALICKCEFAFIDSKFIEKIAQGVEKEGIEFWDKVTLKEMVSSEILDKNFACPNCKNNNLNEFRQERDILDVWFDSGVSHQAVLKQDKNLEFPASLYLEGSDQHRGWFQSSLLAGMVTDGSTPTRTFLTHGFTVDEKGHKMSKSLGNVITPQEIIDRYNRDILRLWIANADYESDVIISETVLKNMAEVYRKIRNTARFLISNLYDFDFTKDAVPLDKLCAIDGYALSDLKVLDAKVRQAYESYSTNAVVQALGSYCTNNLSAFYLDVIKDRLYVEKADGHLRRSAQTACFYILENITRLIAPITSFLADEIKNSYNKNGSIHLESMLNVPEVAQWEEWPTLISIRSVVLKAIEEKRKLDLIRHPLEASVTFKLDHLNSFIKKIEKNESAERFFKEFFIVSEVKFVQDATEVVSVAHARGSKCPRCWQWEETNHLNGLCARCAAIVYQQQF